MIIHVYSCINNTDFFNKFKKYIRSLLPKEKKYQIVNLRTLTIEQAESINKNKYEKYIVFGHSKKGAIDFNYKKKIFFDISQEERRISNIKDIKEYPSEKHKNISFEKTEMKYNKLKTKYMNHSYTLMNLKQIGEFIKNNL